MNAFLTILADSSADCAVLCLANILIWIWARISFNGMERLQKKLRFYSIVLLVYKVCFTAEALA
jgi:hypothetical protein